MNSKNNILLAIAAVVMMAVCFNSCKKEDKIPVITIIRQPDENTVVTKGSTTETILLSASVTEKATLSYQWYSNTANSNTGGTAISDATKTNFAIPTTLVEGTYFYFCEISATGGATTVRSNVAVVTVTDEGSPSNPYIVNSTETLQKVGSGDNGWALNKHYRQTSNITVIIDTIEWAPIGITSAHFTGSYDGGGYSITDLNISTTANTQGLFGYIGSGGAVKNVALINVNINSTGSYIGGIAAYNSGTIENCYVTGTVSGLGSVGGLAGYNVSGGEIKNCYTTCNAAGSNIYVGGIAGYNAGTVANCYATGQVTGTNNVGGIVGVNVNPSATVQQSVALNVEVSITTAATGVGRVVGSVSNGGTLAKNYAREAGMTLKNSEGTITVSSASLPSDKNGTGLNALFLNGSESGTWWPNNSYAGYNSALWSFNANRLPHLKTTTGIAFSQTQNPAM